MNVIDAAYSTVHDYPGGAEALAARMGKSAAVLRSKVNPNTSTHHLTLAEADEILGKTRDLRMLHALAANHGCVVLPADDPAAPAAASVLDAVLRQRGADGSFATVVADAVADGVISPRELADIMAAGAGVQSSIVLLLRKLRDAAAPGEASVPREA